MKRYLLLPALIALTGCPTVQPTPPATAMMTSISMGAVQTVAPTSPASGTITCNAATLACTLALNVPQGLPGANGQDGIQGVQGVPGVGIVGQTGSAGVAGQPGVSGKDGAVGPAGTTTYNGSNGPFATPSINAVISANAFESSPGAGDGMKNAFASPLCTGGMGCTVTIDPTYTFDDGRNYLPSGFGQRLVDRRGGGESVVIADPLAPAQYSGNPGQGYMCLRRFIGYQTQNSVIGTDDCVSINNVLTGSGINLGTARAPGPSGWTTSKALHLRLQANMAGIRQALGINVDCSGIGDCAGIDMYATSKGGFIDGSGEAFEARYLATGESPSVDNGQVATWNPSTYTLTSSNALSDVGVGQYLIDMSHPIASGYFSTFENINNSAGSFGVTLFHTNATIPVSTAWGTSTSDCVAPILPSSGTVSQVSTPTTCTIHTMSGSWEVGDYAVWANDFHEVSPVLAVTTGTPDDTVTFALRHTHTAGGMVFASPWGAGGLELTAQTCKACGSSSDGSGPADMRYTFDAMGAVDAHTIAAVQFVGGTARQIGNIPDINQSVIFINNEEPMTNTAGVVRVPIWNTNTGQGPSMFQNNTITIAGVSDATFNGLCTGVVLSSYPYYSDHQILTCNQTASIGHTLASPAGNITLGDTPYGNTDFVLYPAAEVLDVQNYVPVNCPGGPPCGPVNDGTLRLEPTPMALALDTNVEVPHHYAAGFTADTVGFSFNNRNAGQYSGMDIKSYGGRGMDASQNAGVRYNENAPSMYAGYGGTMSALRGFVLDGKTSQGGVWGSFGSMATAPWPTGSNFLSAGCPIRIGVVGGCADPMYNYNVFAVAGNGQGNAINYTPYSNALAFIFAHITFPAMTTQAPATGWSYACFNASNELVKSLTPCIPTNAVQTIRRSRESQKPQYAH